jgi:hypothetical protein
LFHFNTGQPVHFNHLLSSGTSLALKMAHLVKGGPKI